MEMYNNLFGNTVKSVESNGKKYIVHPAFRDGRSNNFKNGEWKSELSGIWVAKYEASHSDATVSKIGTSSTMKVAPGVRAWGSIQIGAMYTKAYNYDRNKESHLMKLSEWGVVAYLTHSQYGRNGNEIDINNSSNFITGNGGGSNTSTQTVSGVANAYNTEIGAKASSTGNIYGIYDLSGGEYEYVAAYITNADGKTKRQSYGSSFASTEVNVEGYKTLSTEYATVYPFDSSDSVENNRKAYQNANYGYGDAVLEISMVKRKSWNGDISGFLNSSNTFFIVGGYIATGTSAGVFCVQGTDGSGGPGSSFRPVLAF